MKIRIEKPISHFKKTKVKYRKKKRPNLIRIDHWDTWSVDCTIAPIIHALLVQLKKTKHGAPYTDDTDGPEYLRADVATIEGEDCSMDKNHFKRWDWIMDEMIWAFKQKINDEERWMDKYTTAIEHVDENFTDEDEASVIFGRMRYTYDKEGIKKHESRMQNGYLLFGKYYQCLWD